MHIIDDKHLMMIEPKRKKSVFPKNDKYTEMAEKIYANTYTRGSGYKGYHHCKCGKMSDSHDHYTAGGRITNSLLVHYVRYHRSEIPQSELDKLEKEYNLLSGNRSNMVRSKGIK